MSCVSRPITDMHAHHSHLHKHTLCDCTQLIRFQIIVLTQPTRRNGLPTPPTHASVWTTQPGKQQPFSCHPPVCMPSRNMYSAPRTCSYVRSMHHTDNTEPDQEFSTDNPKHAAIMTQRSGTSTTPHVKLSCAVYTSWAPLTHATHHTHHTSPTESSHLSRPSTAPHCW